MTTSNSISIYTNLTDVTSTWPWASPALTRGQRNKRLRATPKRARLAGSGVGTGTPSGTAKPVGAKSAAENPTSKLARGSAAVADKLLAKVIRVSAMLLPAGHNAKMALAEARSVSKKQ